MATNRIYEGAALCGAAIVMTQAAEVRDDADGSDELGFARAAKCLMCRDHRQTQTPAS